MSLLADVRATVHYLSGLCAFWRTPYDARQAADTIRTWLAQRQEAFLDMMRERIYAVPGSPYLRLLEAAGFTLEDVERLTGQVGVEGCARRLLEAGIYVTLDEFKGRQPIERLGLSLPVTMADFAAPTGTSELSWRSGGSRTQGTPIPVSVLDKLTALPPCAFTHLKSNQGGTVHSKEN